MVFARGGLALLILPLANFKVVIPLNSSRDLFMIAFVDVLNGIAMRLRGVRGTAAVRGEAGVVREKALS